jgi:transcriptional regulator with GAF, ATPase, and Fis domain
VPVVGHTTVSAPIADHRSEARGQIVGLRALRTGETIRLPEASSTSVGSSPDCDVAIAEDPTISRLHCQIEPSDTTTYVRDLRSKNGTFVNGNRVECAELRPGSMLTIGRTSFVVVAGDALASRTALECLRGSDPSFRRAIDTAIRAAASDCTVLVLGETGTGKELIARAVHEASPRAAQPFVAINCAAIAHGLAASELFGHVRGAFTGALAARDGLFVHAEGGTVFLDELGELPLDIQPQLLRVLETRRVRPIGGEQECLIDVRFIAATHRLGGLGSASSPIRPDLYHRLAVVEVILPPLRDRLDDLREIVPAILDELAPQFGRRAISPQAWEALYAYGWPGNVRELRQALTRAVALGGAEIGPGDLFPATRARSSLERRTARATPTPAVTTHHEPLRWPVDEAGQRRVMAEALARARSMREAAAFLGVPKSTFAEKALRFGLTVGGRTRDDSDSTADHADHDHG